MQQHRVSEQLLDVVVHFQIVDLGRQLYVWVGTDEARMGAMCLASPTPPGGHASAAWRASLCPSCPPCSALSLRLSAEYWGMQIGK